MNATTHVYRRGEYDQIALSYNNSSAALFPSISNGTWTATACNTQTPDSAYVYDGHGNVAALVSADTTILAAEYAYASFGNLFRAPGILVSVNPFRFSKKSRNDETDWVYYGQRFYSAALSQWG